MKSKRNIITLLTLLLMAVLVAGCWTVAPQDWQFGAAAAGDSNFTNLVASGDITSGDDMICGDTFDLGGDLDLDGDGFDVNVTGAASIDADAASNFSVAGAGIDLTLESEAGRLVLKGDEAAADGVYIDANEAAGTGVTIVTGATAGLAHTGGPVSLSAGTATALLSAPAAAGSGGDIWDVTATFAAMNGSDTSLGVDVNLTGANATGTNNNLWAIDIDLTTADPQVTEKAIDLNDSDWDYAIDTGHVPIVSTAATFMDDFFGATVAIWWTALSGTDNEAVQAIQAGAQYGEYQITSGDTGVNCAGDCEGIALGTHWSADQGSLIFETRLHIDTSITNTVLFAGMTDVATLEMPATITTTVVNLVADDFCGFIFDDAGTTDQWWVACAAGGVAATGNAASGVAPVAAAYQVLRLEIDAAGGDARFYINGALVGTITAGAITITDLLSPMIIVDTNAAESNVVDVDYVFVAAQRN